MANRPFPVNPVMVAIAIAYRNASLIADEVLPRLAPMAKEEFKYFAYDMAEGFTIPDTKVGRRSRVNEISFTGVEITASTEDFGLEDPIPQTDIDNAEAGFDPKNHSVEQLTNLILLDREVRVSTLLSSTSNYDAANTETLAAGSQFSDAAADVLGIMEDAFNAPVMRPNVAVFGQASWSAFRRHPQVVKAVHGNSGDAGMASREQVAELLEVSKVLVGQARVNTARKGQAASLQRAWGDMVSLIYQDAMATNRNGTTYGFTAQYKTRLAGSERDGNIGLRGGERVRVGESVKEVISAKSLGYLIQNTVA
ncbi:hypothetical protein [Thiothrix nivea]|uniref:Phage capsid protein, putative n=1 Tax=Thiothrix nivea (strain ATCC 35100 / DSM 5205 / JP2) TaxID=870187 RepID=A0A656HE66_THINJ|nr:hypothetical protein [Thiothrix nivea]EIJ33325.1 phage capsid protein, putative [Thiothrix nivea DSM 5205]